MILSQNVTLGKDNEEILPMQQRGFAYICKHEHTKQYDPTHTWHWHGAVAINRVVQGETEFHTTQGTYRIKAGEAIFINSNVLHMKKNGNMPCIEIYFHVFETEFLTGGYNPAFAEKYFSSVLNNKDLPVYVIRPDSAQNQSILQKLVQIEQLARDESFGYELQIRALLCEIWLLFLQQNNVRQNHAIVHESMDERRIKTMMQYVHRHYAESLTISDIAASANIGVRECTRCFNRCIHMPPIKYLNDYRLRQAANMLTQTDKTIQQISEACGFSSSGYFARVFRDTMHCTPREYRRQS